MVDVITDSFNISPLVEPGVVDKMMVGTTELLPPLPIERPTPEAIIRDFNIARQNVLEVIESSKEAINQVSDLAYQSQDSDFYDSLTSSLKVMLEANRDLIDLHAKIRRLTGEVTEAVSKVQNNLFVGSTAELTKFLADLKKKDG